MTTPPSLSTGANFLYMSADYRSARLEVAPVESTRFLSSWAKSFVVAYLLFEEIMHSAVIPFPRSCLSPI